MAHEFLVGGDRLFATMAAHDALHRTSSFDGSGGGEHKQPSLRRPSSSGDVTTDPVYNVTEHKKEVRLGLRHRDSFAVHRGHMKGGAGGGAIVGGGNNAAILAAWNKAPTPTGGKRPSVVKAGAAAAAAGSDASAAAAGGGKSAGAGTGPSSDASDADDSGHGSESETDGGAGHSSGGEDGLSPRPRNPFRSMAKGVGSFLGLRKSKRQREAEEAAERAAAGPDAPGLSSSRVVGAARGGIDNYPGQRRPPTVAAVLPSAAAAPVTHASHSAVAAIPLSALPAGSPLVTGGTSSSSSSPRGAGAAGGGAAARPAALPPKVSAASDSSAPKAPPPPGAPPARTAKAAAAAPGADASTAMSSESDASPAGAAAVPAATDSAAARAGGRAAPPPPPPPGNPAAARQAAASKVPPSAPPRAGAPAAPPVSSPVPATPVKGKGADAEASLRESVPGRVPDPINGNHRLDSPVPSILKTSATRRPRDGEAAPSTGRSAGSAGKGRIFFADQHGGRLELIKYCADLHYSAAADHSESEGWEEEPLGTGEEDNRNCVIM